MATAGSEYIKLDLFVIKNIYFTFKYKFELLTVRLDILQHIYKKIKYILITKNVLY